MLTLILAASPWTPSTGQEVQLTNVVKASLIFHEESSPRYPHLLKVYLCLDNRYNSNVSWACNDVEDVDVELLDSNGKPVSQPGTIADVLSNASDHVLPYGSRLEWLLSHGGVSLFHDANNKPNTEESALIIGSKGWLIPRDSLSSYSLRLRVRGWPWTSRLTVGNARPDKILFDVPPTKIVVE